MIKANGIILFSIGEAQYNIYIFFIECVVIINMGFIQNVEFKE